MRRGVCAFLLLGFRVFALTFFLKSLFESHSPLQVCFIKKSTKTRLKIFVVVFYDVVKLLLCRRIKKPPVHKEGNNGFVFFFFFFATTTTILVLLLKEFGGRLFAKKSIDDEDHQ